jgi:hypothetical protein
MDAGGRQKAQILALDSVWTPGLHIGLALCLLLRARLSGNFGFFSLRRKIEFPYKGAHCPRWSGHPSGENGEP